jgi:predicted MPP superfamily phosphohydrolase
MRAHVWVPLGVLAAGIAGVGYGAGYEVRAFRLRRAHIPVLPAGQRPLRVLHLSDLHLQPDQRAKIRWVRSLAALEPDLVVNTGDNLSHREGVPALLAALGPLLDRPGVFVRGSNDYYAPLLRNPARYLLPGGGRRRLHGGELPWRDMTEGLSSAGWLDLDNARAQLTVDGRVIDLVGTDDPHIHRDRYPQVAGPPAAGADLSLAVTHAPYRRVLDAIAGDGWRLVLAGHTHGGQLRVPVPGAPHLGALVTNCDLPRRQARGLSRWPVGGPSGWARNGGGADPAWLHVSAGLGTSPYAPVRFACPPEASLLTLTAAS